MTTLCEEARGCPQRMRDGRGRPVGDGSRFLDEPCRPGGSFSGYLDEIEIETGFSEPLLDGDFVVDDDGDRHPDYWFDASAGADSPAPTPATAIRDDGPSELWLAPASGVPSGAAQLLGSFENPGAPRILAFDVRSDCGGSLSVTLRDPATGRRTAEVVIGPLGDSWQEREALIAHRGRIIPPPIPRCDRRPGWDSEPEVRVGADIRPCGQGRGDQRRRNARESGPIQTTAKSASHGMGQGTARRTSNFVI